jgi:hypothetical protein
LPVISWKLSIVDGFWEGKKNHLKQKPKLEVLLGFPLLHSWISQKPKPKVILK